MSDDAKAELAYSPARRPRAAELHFRGVPAEPQRYPALRHALVGWAENTEMNAEQTEALALASYEALANVNEHAYSGSRPGVLDVQAAYSLSAAHVEVAVRDYGRWQPPSAEDAHGRGRGLLLIKNLAEHTEVTTGEHGTCVRMVWKVGAHSAPD